MEFDKSVLFNISYGLYVLTTQFGKEDNGCIINTLSQITDTPVVVSVNVNKKNYTAELISKSKKFNVSMLSTDAGFDMFQHFGFQSGRDVDKFADFEDVYRSQNGVYFVNRGTNAFISAEVDDIIDFDTHLMFVGHVTDGGRLSNRESMTYTYYQNNVKPKKKPADEGAYVCTVCGYVHEGGKPPADFICPVCKHGASYFVKMDS
ncbi:MAG: flavin reductase [Clostridiales bacterium]|uniref:Flavin reductase n=1 Tax=Candidatus Scybalenecus merdavium TaxID=2840939 RepID=A0A9D1MTM9_9FIRM|nr:flavin reductase [Clostridiales bacterium]HIU68828.1 flavin reductase [Candidatus Scubalenecus merdavium]